MILRRIGSAAVVLLLVSAIVFVISSLLPGDAASEMLGQSATPQAVAALREKLGLNDPAPLRYLHWLKGLLTGDAGASFANRMPVSALIATRLPKSLVLAGLTAALATPLALSLGIFAAVRRGSPVDRALSLATLSMVAVPEFLVATLLVLIFAVKLRWLPSISVVPEHPSLWTFLRGYLLPVLTLTFGVVAQMARMTRAAVIDQLRQPYAEMARLKGLGPARVVMMHALPNAAGPIVNAVALSLSYLLGGAIIVETIFNYPGLASLMVDAVTSRDMPLLQACAMIFCAGYLILVLVADVAAILSNPRLRG
jgi:peptide/nickel transport system permease protein